MNVAVLTLTRNRLAYTKTCFASLQEHAGVGFDHLILDQGSTDGTYEWLGKDYAPKVLMRVRENIGLCPGLNRLLDAEALLGGYDVIVRFDNDCEVTQPDTLRACAEVAVEYDAIVAPRVLGLRNPPPTGDAVILGNYTVDSTSILGGVFMAIPARLFTELGYRFDESSPLALGDEKIVPWWRARGGVCGYLRGFTVNHYETTDGQWQRYPEYFAQKVAEGLQV